MSSAERGATHFAGEPGKNVPTDLPIQLRALTHEPKTATRFFAGLAQRRLPMELLWQLSDHLEQYLPLSADAPRVLVNLERLFQGVADPLALLTFLVRNSHALIVMLQLFASSQYFSDVLIAEPEFFDFLWEQGHGPLEPGPLKTEILAEIAAAHWDEERTLTIIRRHRRRELLRVGYRDIVRGEPLDRLTESISDLADCLVGVALETALHKRISKHGPPCTKQAKPTRVVVLAMGKLGGRELNYSSDIDLIFIYDRDGQTMAERPLDNQAFYTHVVQDVVRLLASTAAGGHAYRVDLRLRPHGSQAPVCLSLEQTLAYYDRYGRTWERQALVKARPVAGDLELGVEFLHAVEPFLYRRYLSFVEINEIKAIKRRIQHNTREAGADSTDLKTGHGGIRDIEFVTQYLQLLHGGNRPEVRHGNTLESLHLLNRAGCINQDECTALETAYRFLRKAEHRLQFLFNLQTHRIPDQPAELDKLAARLGYMADETRGPGIQFRADLRAITDRTRAILNHLMLDLFPEGEQEPLPPGGAESSPHATAEAGEPETDLLLDPRPDADTIKRVLGKYPFTDVAVAFKNLSRLAEEEIPFLSSTRCRHFLANVAPGLLRAIGETPDPDRALMNLEKVTASLGAKGVLWEAFSYNPPLLRLYVNLCSWSQFLSEILINNPGMIDELLDSLVLNRTPSLATLREELDRLLKGARDIDPILHSFKNTQLLQIGVQDILGKQTLPETTRRLSELAEVVIGTIAQRHYHELVQWYGPPWLEENPHRPSAYALLGLGKFGGNELSYHSDLDLVLVYEGDGRPHHLGPLPPEETRGNTSNFFFFTELAQRLVRTAGKLGPLGRLYSIDMRLRPTGSSGSLVIPLGRFIDYYHGPEAALWERQSLTRGRIVHGQPEFGNRVWEAARQAIVQADWQARYVDEMHAMRKRLEASRNLNDPKRRAGGIVDVEFAVQLMQMKYGQRHPQLLCSNLWETLAIIEQLGLWSSTRVATFRAGYTFLRQVESRLRIVYSLCRAELPTDRGELEKLAHRVGYDGPSASARFEQDINEHTARIRQEYLASLKDERGER